LQEVLFFPQMKPDDPNKNQEADDDIVSNKNEEGEDNKVLNDITEKVEK